MAGSKIKLVKKVKAPIDVEQDGDSESQEENPTPPPQDGGQQEAPSAAPVETPKEAPQPPPPSKPSATPAKAVSKAVEEEWVAIAMLERVEPAPTVGKFDVGRLLNVRRLEAKAGYRVPRPVAEALADAKKAVIV